MPAFRDLWLLVGGLANSLKALAWVGIVLICVLYVFAIFVTTEVGKNDTLYYGPSYDGEVWPHKAYFGTVPRSMFTLFQVMTLDGWCDDIVRHIVFRAPFMGVLFVLFLMVTAFGLMNLVVGIIVENTLAAASVADALTVQEEGNKKLSAIDRLNSLLGLADTAHTGELSWEELQAATQSAAIKKLLDVIGLQIDEAMELFMLLDHEKRGRVELKRLVDTFRQLIGGARKRDIVQVEITVGTLAQRLDSLEGKFSGIESEVETLTNLTDEFLHTTVRALCGYDGENIKKTTK